MFCRHTAVAARTCSCQARKSRADCPGEFLGQPQQGDVPAAVFTDRFPGGDPDGVGPPYVRGVPQQWEVEDERAVGEVAGPLRVLGAERLRDDVRTGAHGVRRDEETGSGDGAVRRQHSRDRRREEVDGAGHDGPAVPTEAELSQVAVTVKLASVAALATTTPAPAITVMPNCTVTVWGPDLPGECLVQGLGTLAQTVGQPSHPVDARRRLPLHLDEQHAAVRQRQFPHVGHGSP